MYQGKDPVDRATVDRLLQKAREGGGNPRKLSNTGLNSLSLGDKTTLIQYLISLNQPVYEALIEAEHKVLMGQHQYWHTVHRLPQLPVRVTQALQRLLQPAETGYADKPQETLLQTARMSKLKP